MRAEKQLPQRYTVEAYLQMERASEVRHEYLDGAIFEMAGETIPHGRICSNLVISLGAQLRGKDCDVFTKDMKVRSGALPSPRRVMKGIFSYPDVVIVCGKPQVHDAYTDILLNPQVIIEVLSEATEAFDRGEKFQRYREHLPSLMDYLLVAQVRPYVEHFTRRDAERWELVSYAGTDSVLALSSLDCRLRLGDIYERVEFPPPVSDVAEELPSDDATSQG
ncbi:MAG: Uma2 family endonuclease [Pyrinomonadaceae bacterium]